MAFRTLSVEEFSDMLAAKTPTPGGGAVAAVTASHAAALGAMVLEFSLGKPKFAEHEATNASALARLRELRHEALELADRDAEAYGALNALWKLPKDAPARLTAWDAAVAAAIDAPLPTGGSVSLKIPPGTASGKKMRIPGKGVPAAGGKPAGDLYVVVQIVPPKDPSELTRSLLKEIGGTLENPRARIAHLRA
jgi:hypothetical protein